MNHETVELKRSGRTFNIDKGIAPLIELIWKFDLWTLNSCQENRPGIAWIQFAHVQDAETFMALAVDHRGSEKSEDYYNSLYSRIMGKGTVTPDDGNILLILKMSESKRKR